MGTDGAEDIELVTILDVLGRAGLQVTLYSVDSSNNRFTCANGCTLVADNLSLPSSVSSIDALVLPGGSAAAQSFSTNPAVQKLIQETRKCNDKILAAICASPMALATAGALDGVKATIYPSMERHLTDNKAIPLTDRVVVDQNVVTSQGPGTAMAFALKLVDLLAGENVAAKVKAALLYVD